MSARLFRSFRKKFLTSPKVLLLPLFFLVLFLVKTTPLLADSGYTSPTPPSTPVPAPTQTSLDAQYLPYVNNFTTSNDGSTVSGITGGTIINSTLSNNTAGLAFTINLGINSSANGDSIPSHWGRVAIDNDNFLIELCASGGQCWLNNIAYTKTEPDTVGQHIIAAQNSTQDNFNDAQSVSVSAFGATSSNPNNDLYKYDSTSQTATKITSLQLSPGSTMTATLWYCANGEGANAATIYQTNHIPISNNNPTTFGSNICGGFSYFQIGAPLSLTIPADIGTAQQQAATSVATLATTPTASSSDDDTLPECGVVPGWQHGTINGCVADVTYFIYYLCAWVAGLCGQLFDFFIGYSVSSASYSYPFIVTGWTLVRNISNIFFIIIMVFTGFSAVFDTEKTSMKKVVPALIVNAFLINFSLFATRVVIDVSNIGARMFYSEMLVCQQKDLVNGVCTAAKEETGLGGYWPLSQKIVSSFNPQTMFKPSILNPPTTNTDGSQNVTAAVANGITTENARTTANYFAVVSLIAAVIMVAIAVMFFKVAFLFLGRVVGLYICMIFSPFAFLSQDIPMLGKIPSLNWGAWKSDLTNYALLAPVFTFFLYIIYTFLSSNFVQQIGVQAIASSGFFATVMSIAIPMLIIYSLMEAAQKTAVELSGKIGKEIQKYGEQATGLAVGAAVGVATGGASLAGTRLGSRATKAIGEKTGLTNWAATNADNNVFARWTNNTLSKAQTGSWDIRETKVGGLLKSNPIYDKLGITSNVNKYAGLGQDYTKGGFKGQQERRQKEIQDNIKNAIKYDHLTDEEAKIAWERHQNNKAKKVALDKYAELKNGDYEAAKFAIEKNNTDLEKKQKEIDAIKKELQVQKDTISKEEEAKKNKDIETKEKELKEIKKNITEEKEKQATALKTVKVPGYEDSPGYKTELKKAQDEQKIKDEKKYGEIKNQKTLTEAMSRDYSDDLRNNSVWMKDGKPREGLVTAAVMTGRLLGAESIKFEQEALDAATKEFNKNFDKNHGKASKASQLDKKIKDFDELVKKALVDELGHSEAKFKEMEDDEKKTEFESYVNTMRDNFEAVKTEHSRIENEYKKDPTPANMAILKNSIKTKRESEDKLNKMKDLWDKREKAQEELKKETAPKDDKK